MVFTATAQPQTSWLERQHDFGVFKEENGKVSCQMRVVNTGTEPLIIINVQVGCGCTAIDYPQDAIQPGDTAAVTVTYNPSGRPGQFTKQAIVSTNTVTRRTTLEITGNVIPTEATLNKQYPLKAGALRISQKNIPFGELIKGKNKTLYLSAYNASTDTIVVNVKGGRIHIRPAVVPDTVPPARVTALTVHYSTKNAPLWGLNTDTLTLVNHPLNGAQESSADVYVMAQVLEDFDQLTDKERQDAPVVQVDCGDRIDFGTIPSDATATRTFKVTNKGKNPLSIRRLWVPEDEGVVIKTDRTEIKRGKQATVTVTVDASHVQDNVLNVPLTLICNDPETPRQTIRLVGIIDKK